MMYLPKKWNRVLMVAGLVVLAVACAGTIKNVEIDTPIGVKIKIGEATITIDNPWSNDKVYLYFKDEKGNVVAEDCIEGGSGTIPKPDVPFKTVDYTTDKPQKQVEAEPLPVERVVFGSLDGVVAAPIGVTPQPTQTEYVYACVPHVYDSQQMNPTYHATVKATDQAEANVLGASIGQNGVGAVVPADVTVDHFVRSTVIGSDVWVGSSKVGDFAAYQLVVNGALVADLSTQTNVVTIDEGNGWKTLWSAVPGGLLGTTDNVVVVTQRLVGQTNDYVVTTTFDI